MSAARYTEQVQRYTNLFMGMLGHDIRNPLGTITMSAELLVRSGQLQAKSAEPIVMFSVHNFGNVIPLEDRERIFEPRSRGSVLDEKRAPNGLGLGLYISREIMRAHAGTLSVRSTAEEGTTLVARLPRKPPGVATTAGA